MRSKMSGEKSDSCHKKSLFWGLCDTKCDTKSIRTDVIPRSL
nr:MAG TPA: hypothetical protein [Caudoviricetes sp.]